MRISRRLLLLLLAMWFLPALLAAQGTCQLPAVPITPRPAGMISPEQERWIGEAVAGQLESDFNVVEDDPILDYLQRVGQRIAERVPDPSFRFEFRLVDLPVVNAFAFPGGRIYVTRKLVAFTENEDELAGVLAHEIGHVVTHEIAQNWTNLFRLVLKATEFGGREQIFELYHQLQDNGRQNPKAFRKANKDREQGQHDADAIALYLVAHAGYSPRAYVELWDRYNETKGKTGNWFSDMFGTTKPEARRLREMLRAGKEISPACQESLAAKGREAYDQWKQEVVAYTGVGRKESLPGLLTSVSLNPPLQADMHTLRFSPDGKLLLAQNDSSIYVLSRNPMKVLFRIDAPEAYPARFSADSQQVALYTPGLRVETWGVAERQRTDVREMVIREGCLQTELSPDGKALACLSRAYDLMLVDTESAEVLLKKSGFYVPDFFRLLNLLVLQILSEESAEINFHFVEMQFSPDARYFLASGAGKVAFDLTSRTPVSLPGGVKKMMDGSFTFMGADHLFGATGRGKNGGGLVQFPSGVAGNARNVGGARVTASGDGKFLLLRPIDKYPVGIMNLDTGKIFLAHEKEGMDIYADRYVKQTRGGEIGVFDAGTRHLVEHILLPEGPLGRLRAAAISSDLQWLAVSERGRGAVWGLKDGRRLYHTRGFRGAYFDGRQKILLADFPKFEKEDRTLARLNLGQVDVQPTIKLEDRNVSQHGPYLFVRIPDKKKEYSNENVTFEIRETSTDRVLWTEKFAKEAPRVHLNWQLGTVAYRWNVSSRTAKGEIKQDVALQARAKALREKEGDYYLRIVELKTGKTLGRLLVETGKGSFRITDVLAVGDHVVLADSENRVLAYSLSSGEQKARVFGRRPEAAIDGSRLAVEAGRGQLVVYDLSSMSKSCELVFPRELSLVQFTPDGRRLLALTNGQRLYSVDLSVAAQAATAKSAPSH